MDAAIGSPMKITYQYAHSKWGSKEPIEIVLETPEMYSEDFGATIEDINNHKHIKRENDWKILVGLNGTGKTTLLRLIDEFHSIQEEGRIPTETQISTIVNSWKKKGVETFSVKSELNYNNHDGWCMQIGHPDLEYLQSVFRTKEGFLEQKKDSLTTDISYDDFSKKIEDFDYLKKLIETGWMESWIIGEDLANIKIEIISEFDLLNDSFGSRMNIVYTDLYDLFGLTKKYDVRFTLEFSNPFGPDDFHMTMQQIFQRISLETGMKVEGDEFYGIFKSPKCSTVYLDALEKSKSSKMIDSNLFGCIGDDLIIEDYMEKLNLEEVWRIFDVEHNDSKLRTFEEFPYIEYGSDEYFSTGQINRHVSDDDWKIVVDRGNGNVEELDIERYAKLAPALIEYGAFPTIKDNYEGDVKYHPPTTITVCRILPEKYNYIVHRWQESVIYYPSQGLIYSTSKESLFHYLTRDLWRNISLKNRIHILSKVFSVEESQLKALFALKELTPNLESYLTSGQSRVFSMMEKALRDDIDIVLLDEPEVSLHIDWQRKILDLIDKHSSSKFILAATHSPDIIYHHLDNVIELDSAIDT
jgi:ABC-type lipoprotein export system ATPase subunit